MSAAALVAQLDLLLAATPEPPADAEPAELIDTLAAMLPVRERLLAELVALGPTGHGQPDVLARHQALARREQAWCDALGRARGVVGSRLVAVNRSRARQDHRR